MQRGSDIVTETMQAVDRADSERSACAAGTHGKRRARLNQNLVHEGLATGGVRVPVAGVVGLCAVFLAVQPAGGEARGGAEATVEGGSGPVAEAAAGALLRLVDTQAFDAPVLMDDPLEQMRLAQTLAFLAGQAAAPGRVAAKPPPANKTAATGRVAVMPPPDIETAASIPRPRRRPAVARVVADPALRVRPVGGRVVQRFGSPDPNGGARRGIGFRAAGGAVVRAPAAGTVAFAGQFRGYGLLLIVEHADGYHTLLAGLGRIDSSSGAHVTAGDALGVMGDTPGDPPILYMELRHDGRSVDPLPWLSPAKRKAS